MSMAFLEHLFEGTINWNKSVDINMSFRTYTDKTESGKQEYALSLLERNDFKNRS